MLVDVEERGHELTGYLVANRGQTGFAIPVFRSISSNRPLLQIIGADDRVVGFSELADSRHLCDHPDTTIMTAEGLPALWAFAEADGTLKVARRALLAAALAPTIDARTDPFLQLQIVQFCGMKRELTARWKATFAYMDDASPRSATAWRDVVIVPAGARAAVAAAAVSNGLGDLLENPGRAVSVRVIEDRTVITLEQRLHDAFLDNPAAIRALRSGTLAQRQAFGFRSDVITRAKTMSGQVPFRQADGSLLIAVGELALRLVRHNRSDERSLNGSIRKAPSSNLGVPNVEVVDTRSFRSEQKRVHDDRLDLADDATLFVLLEVSGDDPAPVTIALDLCRAHSGGRRRLVAVVPNLPANLIDERGLVPWRELAAGFDAVWALSDLSPHTRQNLSFGGGHSLAAAARRLEELLILAEDDAFPLTADPKTPDRISVFGTAVGGLSPRGLLQHAGMKIAVPSLDFTQANLVVAGAGPNKPSRDWLARVLEPILSGTLVLSIRVPKGIGDSTGVIAFTQVPLIPVDLHRLEVHCLDQLRANGWDVLSKPKEGARVVFLDGIDWEILLPTIEVVQPAVTAELWDPDRRSIRFTVQTVGRRDFVAGVLFDAVPVNVVRIPVMEKIMAGRWQTVVGILRDRRFQADDLLVAAILVRADRLNGLRAGSRQMGLGFGLAQRPQIIVHHNHLTVQVGLRRGDASNQFVNARLDPHGLHVTIDPMPS